MKKILIILCIILIFICINFKIKENYPSNNNVVKLSEITSENKNFPINDWEYTVSDSLNSLTGYNIAKTWNIVYDPISDSILFNCNLKTSSLSINYENNTFNLKILESNYPEYSVSTEIFNYRNYLLYPNKDLSCSNNLCLNKTNVSGSKEDKIKNCSDLCSKNPDCVGFVVDYRLKWPWEHNCWSMGSLENTNERWATDVFKQDKQIRSTSTETSPLKNYKVLGSIPISSYIIINDWSIIVNDFKLFFYFTGASTSFSIDCLYNVNYSDVKPIIPQQEPVKYNSLSLGKYSIYSKICQEPDIYEFTENQLRFSHQDKTSYLNLTYNQQSYNFYINQYPNCSNLEWTNPNSQLSMKKYNQYIYFYPFNLRNLSYLQNYKLNENQIQLINDNIIEKYQQTSNVKVSCCTNASTNTDIKTTCSNYINTNSTECKNFYNEYCTSNSTSTDCINLKKARDFNPISNVKFFIERNIYNLYPFKIVSLKHLISTNKASVTGFVIHDDTTGSIYVPSVEPFQISSLFSSAFSSLQNSLNNLKPATSDGIDTTALFSLINENNTILKTFIFVSFYFNNNDPYLPTSDIVVNAAWFYLTGEEDKGSNIPVLLVKNSNKYSKIISPNYWNLLFTGNYPDYVCNKKANQTEITNCINSYGANSSFTYAIYGTNSNTIEDTSINTSEQVKVLGNLVNISNKYKIVGDIITVSKLRGQDTNNDITNKSFLNSRTYAAINETFLSINTNINYFDNRTYINYFSEDLSYSSPFSTFLSYSNRPFSYFDIKPMQSTNVTDCIMSEWDNTSENTTICTKAVNGRYYKQQNRTIVSNPQNNGIPCGPLSRIKECTTIKDCKIDWSNNIDSKTICAKKSDGKYYKTQTKIIVQQPENGGTICPTQYSSTREVECTTIKDCELEWNIKEENSTNCIGKLWTVPVRKIRLSIPTPQYAPYTTTRIDNQVQFSNIIAIDSEGKQVLNISSPSYTLDSTSTNYISIFDIGYDTYISNLGFYSSSWVVTSSRFNLQLLNNAGTIVFNRDFYNNTRSQDSSGWTYIENKYYKTENSVIKQQPEGGGDFCPIPLPTRKLECSTIKDCAIDLSNKIDNISYCTKNTSDNKYYKSQSYFISQSPQNGGGSCPNPLPSPITSECTTIKPCILGDWNNQSDSTSWCTKNTSDGKYYKNQTRIVAQQAQNGGEVCPSPLPSRNTECTTIKDCIVSDWIDDSFGCRKLWTSGVKSIRLEKSTNALGSNYSWASVGISEIRVWDLSNNQIQIQNASISSIGYASQGYPLSRMWDGLNYTIISTDDSYSPSNVVQFIEFYFSQEVNISKIYLHFGTNYNQLQIPGTKLILKNNLGNIVYSYTFGLTPIETYIYNNYYKQQYKTIIQQSQNGGTVCPISTSLNRTIECTNVKDCIVNWNNELENTSICSLSTTDNKYYKTQTATILQQPQSGGEVCPNPLSKTVECTSIKPCIVSDWNNQNENTSICSLNTSDNKYYKTQTRSIIQQPQNAGLACPTPLSKTVECTSIKPCIVSSNWTDSSSCSTKPWRRMVKKIRIEKPNPNPYSAATIEYLSKFSIFDENNIEISSSNIVPSASSAYPSADGNLYNLFDNDEWTYFRTDSIMTGNTNPIWIDFTLSTERYISKIILNCNSYWGASKGFLSGCTIKVFNSTNQLLYQQTLNTSQSQYIINNISTKTQTTTITQQPQNGGQACPALTRTVNCLESELPPLEEPFSAGTLRDTGWNDDGGGNAIYLDRHNIDCGTNGINNLFLTRNGSTYRYNYKCSSGGRLTTSVDKDSGWNDDGGGNAIYLDRHNIACDSNGLNHVLSKLQLVRSGGSYRYNMKCSPSLNNLNCVQKNTGWNDDGGGNAIYLDRHNITCESDEVISQLQLVRSGGSYRYNYKCCKSIIGSDINNPVIGRYVWIVARDSGIPLNIARIRVYNTSNVDIASGKPVAGSSILPGWTVSSLTTETQAFAHTNSNTGKPEWMRIDLGSDQTIKNIGIWNRWDCCRDRLDGAYILIQTDSEFTSTLNDRVGIKKFVDQYSQPIEGGKYYYNISFQNKNYSLESNKDYPGNDIEYYNGNFTDCQSRCNNLPNCVGYALHKDNGRNCWMKSSLSGSGNSTTIRDTYRVT
jgi:hypothetical protein